VVYSRPLSHPEGSGTWNIRFLLRRARNDSTPSPARAHLGSLDRVTRVVRLGVSVSTSGDVRDQPKVADAASELLQEVFGKEKSPCRLVYGVASLPLGTPVELEIIFEVGNRRGEQ
jgi:enamine deaminase RidA (YjgF/YER057c/UK114 family)